MKGINYAINNNFRYSDNNLKDLQLFNDNNMNNNLNIKEKTNSQSIIQEMQSSLDSILNNLREKTPIFKTQNNSNYEINKAHLYRTPNTIITKKYYNNMNTPNIISYNNQNTLNKIIFRNYPDLKIKNKILQNQNKICLFNTNNNNNNQKRIINNVIKELKFIKKNNEINKSEILLFKKEYYEMEKIIIKGIEKYVALVINNLKKRELEKMKDILDDDNNRRNEIKEMGNIFNNLKDKEIKEIICKYEGIIKDKNEKIDDLDFEILKLNLEKKKILHEQLKKNLSKINIRFENNNNKIKKIDKKNEINLSRYKSYDGHKKKIKDKKIKSPSNQNISDNNINQKNNNDILSENKKYKKEILLLKSKANNFRKLYVKYKKIADELILENNNIKKERDEFKIKKAELNNEMENE